jgi:MFS family permease
MNDPDIKNKKRRRIKKKRCCVYNQATDASSNGTNPPTVDSCNVSNAFKQQQTWEIWLIFIIKLFTSIIFLIDDLTFLLYCQYEYKMTPSEAGILFCISAVCLFCFGLSISGFIIDKIGVKGSLILGLILYAAGKFILVFADTRFQLYFVMITVVPLGISIVFPSLMLGVKRLTKEDARPIGFNIFYGAMVLGAVFGGPIVDWIRHDYHNSSFDYHHTNIENGKEVER